MSIRLQQINKSYGEQQVLRDFNLDIRKGEIVAFLGPNGAGKSTTLRIIAGLLMPESGKAEVCGFDLATQSIEVKRRIGYLPENNPLYTDMYVREYLEFAAGFYHIEGNLRKRIDELVEQTGLTREQNKKIGQLSKGYRQRVGLAQALIHNPEVLILDEPTTGLDPNQLVEIRRFIREISLDKTVILSTHILQEASAMCDRTIIINKGEIVADGKTADLLASGISRQSFVVEFLTPADISKLKAMEGVISLDIISETEYHLTADCDLREAIFRFAVGQNLVLLTLTRREHSLEEVFSHLTL